MSLDFYRDIMDRYYNSIRINKKKGNRSLKIFCFYYYLVNSEEVVNFNNDCVNNQKKVDIILMKGIFQKKRKSLFNYNYVFTIFTIQTLLQHILMGN